MQINRLFEIVYILLDKKVVTAKDLSERFEVSQRTIYRDIDTLSSAGIPIYTNKGKGGGISLMDDFILNKSLLSEQEQNEILMSLQSLNAVNYQEHEPVLSKLSILFNKQGMNWIDVDFSRWGSDDSERERFSLLKTAILKGKVVTFAYYSSYGVKTERKVEPVKILFKGQSWYIYGYCREKSDFRIFKITRMNHLEVLDETFKRAIPADIWDKAQDHTQKMVNLVLRIDEKMAFRLYDEFDQASIIKNKDGSFEVRASFPEEWVYGYLMSYGADIEVLEPKQVRETIKLKFEESLKKYL